MTRDIDEDAGLDGRGGPYFVPGLDRGLRILMEFSPREPVLGAPELARRLEIPRTTVFRLLQTLESLGFLERADKDKSYRLGVAVLRLGFEYLSSLELTDFGAPIIERLRDETGLTSHIVIRDGRDIVFVAKAQSYESGFSSVRVHVGTRLPAYATVHGRLLMSGLTFKELKALFPESRLQQYTDRTPQTVTQLYKLIQEDIQRGFVVSESSFERGISVVTAPVRDDVGQVTAVITVTIPRAEITPRELASGLVEKVRAAADALSLRLNYRPEAISKPSRYLKSLGL
ncbi:IclR family transcriptional regulator [Caballeronia novacaledonica]|uniref:IclR family transcriptional regulator n=1 Tax=Caballeronia novacaledonica TaxID=1544861 RepID=A0AA37MT32_9BURK|nr:IclR family transcriptional regulator [Caballeronia novacaledonica]GJH30991.1 IclR family transcriptional regulator [Caballeronia novacaledonica]